MRWMFLLCVLLSAACASAQPVKENGKLHVNGVQLLNEKDEPVILRGMSFGWHNFWPRFYNKGAVNWLATDWKCTVVRAAMGIEPKGGYLEAPADSRAKIEAVVDAAIKAGIYVIIDWHSHNIQTNEAKNFFTAMALKYGKYPNVIYEIFNEPDEESWQQVKTYSTEIINAIRKVDPDNIILAGSPHWDQDIHIVADDPLQGFSNIMYTVHFYAATHKQELRARCDYALNKGIPVFISESAGMEATGDGPLNEEEWVKWIDWCEKNQVSWITWSVSDKDETCSVLTKKAGATGNWKAGDLKQSGIKSRQLLRSYAEQKNNVLPASAMHPSGRTLFNKNDGVELISSASHVGFSFTGNECKVYASVHNMAGHNYLQYELDGVYQKRIKIEGNKKEPFAIVARGNGRHTVWLYKATEAQTGPVFIEKVTATNIKALEKKPEPVIEFIGNSITCGAAADASEVPCGTGQYHDQHNAYMAYGPRVARALKTNFVVSSVSGYGIYRNWNSDGPTLPMVYTHARLTSDDSATWNFSTYSPAIVSIALGTNDYSDGDGKTKRLPFDSARFVTTYISFVQLVKSKYPATQILLLSSPMLGGARRNTLQNCIAAVKAAIDKGYPASKPVQVYFFRQMTPRGCSGHPSVEDHAILAAELVPVYRRLLRMM